MLSEIKVTSRELRTVREAMRELNRMIDALDEGELEKVVLTHRNEWRAVVLPISEYDAMLRTMEVCRASGVTGLAAAAHAPTHRDEPTTRAA
jgi:PHD/YefM family antitoxin component YafN of YafNO toxin-antitoxin module